MPPLFPKWRAAYYGFNIIDQIPLSPAAVSTNQTQIKLQSLVNGAEGLDAYIWVIFSDDIPAVQNFFVTAQPILSATTFFLGTSAISSADLWKSPRLTYNYVSTILGGYIGIQQATDDWKHTPKVSFFSCPTGQPCPPASRRDVRVVVQPRSIKRSNPLSLTCFIPHVPPFYETGRAIRLRLQSDEEHNQVRREWERGVVQSGSGRRRPAPVPVHVQRQKRVPRQPAARIHRAEHLGHGGCVRRPPRTVVLFPLLTASFVTTTPRPLGFIYDAVFVTVEAIVYYQLSVQKAGTQLLFPSVMNGNGLANTMAVKNVSFVGATGTVGFEAGTCGPDCRGDSTHRRVTSHPSAHPSAIHPYHCPWPRRAQASAVSQVRSTGLLPGFDNRRVASLPCLHTQLAHLSCRLRLRRPRPRRALQGGELPNRRQLRRPKDAARGHVDEPRHVHPVRAGASEPYPRPSSALPPLSLTCMLIPCAQVRFFI